MHVLGALYPRFLYNRSELDPDTQFLGKLKFINMVYTLSSKPLNVKRAKVKWQADLTDRHYWSITFFSIHIRFRAW